MCARVARFGPGTARTARSAGRTATGVSALPSRPKTPGSIDTGGTNECCERSDEILARACATCALGWSLGDALRFGVGAGRPRGGAERHGAPTAAGAVFGTGHVRRARGRRRGPAPLAAAGDFADVGPGEPVAYGRIVAVRADRRGRATLVRLMAVESYRSLPRAVNPGPPDMEVTRARETMIRGVVVFVGRAV